MTEETSEKTTTEVFYETSEAKEQGVNEGEKETKPNEEAAATQDSEKDEAQSKESDDKGEAEGEGEGKKDEKPADDLELKSVEDLKIAEGAQLNAETVKEVYEQAKELGLNKAQAQAFLESRTVTNEMVQDRAKAAVEDLKQQWLNDFMNDPEIGGDKAVETAEHAKRAIDAFASESFKKVLDESQFGNHPEMLRMFSKVGQKMIANDSFISGKPATGTPKSTADLFYGSES